MLVRGTNEQLGASCPLDPSCQHTDDHLIETWENGEQRSSPDSAVTMITVILSQHIREIRPSICSYFSDGWRIGFTCLIQLQESDIIRHQFGQVNWHRACLHSEIIYVDRCSSESVEENKLASSGVGESSVRQWCSTCARKLAPTNGATLQMPEVEGTGLFYFNTMQSQEDLDAMMKGLPPLCNTRFKVQPIELVIPSTSKL